jgi:hypothetical protein
MKLHLTFLAAILLVARATALSPSPKHGTKPSSANAASAVNRREALVGATAATAAALVGESMFLPTEASAAQPSGAEAFVGTFTDPINHPGGTRTIQLLEGKKVGDYQLAEVNGGGGRGEPANYVLPAVVIGDRTIVIDFSPKGGPRDFAGVLDKGDIKFLRDGNRWPRQ